MAYVRNKTTFKAGEGGRPKGVKNKTTRMVKDIFTEVFNEMQNSPKVKLLVWAKKEPTEFYKLAAKLIPTEIKADLSGKQEIILKIVRDSNQTNGPASGPTAGTE